VESIAGHAGCSQRSDRVRMSDGLSVKSRCDGKKG
jgi:hypothetical protein